jgi:hypothetical protein
MIVHHDHCIIGLLHTIFEVLSGVCRREQRTQTVHIMRTTRSELPQACLKVIEIDSRARCRRLPAGEQVRPTIPCS